MAVGAVVFVLVCTLIGWLVGYPLLGLLVGVVLVTVGAYAHR